MALPEPARSEWVTQDGARYAATVAEAERAFGAVPFVPHDSAPSQQVDSGACTQVLLRKGRDGKYTLLLNGRESTAVTGVHTLPPYRATDLVTEDATKRRVPAPVVVSVLVESGACLPDDVRVQVLQRTYVSGTWIDEGRETVAMEAQIEPTLTSDVESKAVVVAYPMRVSPSARIVFVDRSEERRKEASAKSGVIQEALRLVGNAVQQQLPNVRTFTTLLGNLGAMGLGALTAGLASYYTIIVSNAMATGTPLALSTAAGYLLTVVNSGYVTWRVARSDAQAEAGDTRTTEVSVFDMPTVLRRVISAQSGGLYSNLGEGWTLDELRRAKRPDDAALLQFLTFAPPAASERVEANVKAFEDLQRASFDQLTSEDEFRIRRAVRQYREMQQASELEQGTTIYDQWSVTGLSEEDEERASAVESVLRLVVVDTRRDSAEQVRETFTLVSDVAKNAGLVASGYLEVRERLATEFAQGRSRLLTPDQDLITSPLSQQLVKQATNQSKPNLLRDLADLLTGNNQSVFAPKLEDMARTLADLMVVIDAELEEALSALNEGDLLPRAPLTRVLPHVLQLQNRAAYTFILDNEDEAATVASSSTATVSSADGLRDAIQFSTAILRAVRAAVAQFVQTDGVTRPRTRTQLLLAAPAAPAQQPLPRLRALLDALGGGNVGILTRMVYAPRLPIDLVGALACRAHEKRYTETSALHWLEPGDEHAPPPRAAIALGLPPTHAGELVLGVLADLAIDDALDRARSGTHLSPSRAQTMASAVAQAVDRLSLAHDLASVVYRSGPVHARLPEDDPVFACYPEGPTLRKLLRESAAWRNWRPNVENTKRLGAQQRTETRAIAAMDTPDGAESVGDLLRAIGALKHPAAEHEMHASSFPFLPSQTLQHHSDDVLTALCTTTTPIADSKCTRTAWCALAAQAEHALHAARRLHVLAVGLQLVESRRAALLRECALARPILTLVPVDDDLLRAVPPASQGPLRAFATQPIADLPQPLQPSVPSTPAARTLLGDHREPHPWLRERLAAMRLDVERHQHERPLEEPEDALLASFERMSLGPVQYLVPFAGALGFERASLLDRCIEDMPVYFELWRRAADAPVPSTHTPPPIEPRAPHDGVNDLHPHVIAAIWQGDDGELVALSSAFARIPRVDWGTDAMEVPRTLHEATQAAAVAATAHGLGVDAAAAFLFNVERLVQCALVAAGGKVPPPVLLAKPPPFRPPKEVPKPPAVLRGEALRQRSERRVWVPVIAIGMGYDDVTRANLGHAWLSETLQAVEGSEKETLAAELEPLAQQNKVAIVVRRMDIPDPEGRLYDALRDKIAEITIDFPTLDAFVESLPAAFDNAREWARELQVQQYKYFLSALDAEDGEYRKRREAYEKRWEHVDAENARRMARAEEDHRTNLFLWPAVVGVANAVVGSLLAAPPMLVCSDEGTAAGAQVFREAVRAWRARGLAAAPLCEVAAAVVASRLL